MTAIPIRRDLATRRGWYRAQFHEVPDFTLLVPLRFVGHLTYGQLAQWPDKTRLRYKQLTYVPAPRRVDQPAFRF